MGLKKMFKKRDPTEQELLEEMQKVGISTKTTGGRQEKFGAFKQYAQERQGARPGFAPVNPYANMDNAQGNPYSSGQGNGAAPPPNGNPYGAKPAANPYLGGASAGNGSQNGASASPYASAQANPYGRPSSRPSEARPARASPYDKAAGKPNPYGARARDDELTLDLNDIPSTAVPSQIKRPVRRQETDSLDLNDLPDEDLNVEVDDFLPEQEQVNSEDEEIEQIRLDIRFVKQESLALTRNTLRMAQEADALGTNTLGMLGSQSERLYNAEQNLLLADTQTKIADSKVKELKRLNRSIFIPATGNPFNKKSRLRQQELKLKTDKEQEKYLRETNRQGMYASEQRVKQGITNNATSLETHSKYQNEKYLLQAQRYQFENDSEDDEMEKELGSNLDQIANYSKKLRSTAQTIGQEVGAQNDRLRKIEEDADRLDINVHLNSSRLNNIR